MFQQPKESSAATAADDSSAPTATNPPAMVVDLHSSEHLQLCLSRSDIDFEEVNKAKDELLRSSGELALCALCGSLIV